MCRQKPCNPGLTLFNFYKNLANYQYVCVLQGSQMQVVQSRQVLEAGMVQTPLDDFVGPILLPDGQLACSHCSYKTDKRCNWYKHKRKHIGKIGQ